MVLKIVCLRNFSSSLKFGSYLHHGVLTPI